MRLALLTRDPGLYSSRRLAEAARAQGHALTMLDPLRCSLRMVPGGLEVWHAGQALAGVDAVIARFGSQGAAAALAVLRQLELQGVAACNGAAAIMRARDKLHCQQLLVAEGLPMPPCVAGGTPETVPELLALLGPAPHVIKLAHGSQGLGVMLGETLPASRSIIEALHGLQADFLVQRFIAEARGTDIRCLVIGGRVVAAMRRQAQGEEFRSNLHRGGQGAPVCLSAEEAALAVRAAGIIGLEVAGVDLLRSAQGPLLLEVNAMPGLEGIERACGLDLAGQIVRQALARAAPA